MLMYPSPARRSAIPYFFGQQIWHRARGARLHGACPPLASGINPWSHGPRASTPARTSIRGSESYSGVFRWACQCRVRATTRFCG